MSSLPSPIEHLFIHTVEVRRPTQVSDGQGGFTSPTLTLISNVFPCRIRAATPREIQTARQDKAELTNVMDCASNSDIRKLDQITFGVRTFEVIGIQIPSLTDHHWMVQLTEDQKGGQDLRS